MNRVFCTVGGSMNNVCHISTSKTVLHPLARSQRQDECDSIDKIKTFIKETKCEFVMFGMRASGIPNRAVNVKDTEKLEKAFKRYEKIVNRLPVIRGVFDAN